MQYVDLPVSRQFRYGLQLHRIADNDCPLCPGEQGNRRSDVTLACLIDDDVVEKTGLEWRELTDHEITARPYRVVLQNEPRFLRRDPRSRQLAAELHQLHPIVLVTIVESR